MAKNSGELTPEKLQAHMERVAREVEEVGIDPATLAVLKDQMLICLVNRAGGKVNLPIPEVDGTGRFVMTMGMSNGIFTLEVLRKQ